MVSIGSGFNNPYAAYGNQQTGRSQNTESAESNRAPKIPNIPPKKTENVKEHYSGSVSSTWGFGPEYTKEQAIQYFNETIGNMLRQRAYGELLDKTNCQYVNIENFSYDITSFNVVENKDGSFAIEYTAQITYDYSYIKESDWEVGDTYKDEDGYIWEYQEDGSWKDVTNSIEIVNDGSNYDNDSGIVVGRETPDGNTVNDGGTVTGGGTVVGGGTVIDGTRPHGDDKMPNEYKLSTEEFLNLRNVGITFANRPE